MSEVDQSIPAEATPAAASAEPAAEAKPARKRAPRAKSASVDAVAEQVATAAGEAAQEAPAKPARKTTRTRKAAAVAGDEAPAAEAAPAPAAKPRRTRRPAVKAEPVAEAASAEALQEKEASVASDDAPKPRRTRRPAAKRVEEEAAAPAAPARDAVAEGEAAEAPKPRRTRRPAAKAAAPAGDARADAPADGATADAVASEKPVRAASAPGAADAPEPGKDAREGSDDAAAPAADVETASEDAPKPRRTRARRDADAAAADAGSEEPASEPSGDEAEGDPRRAKRASARKDERKDDQRGFKNDRNGKNARNDRNDRGERNGKQNDRRQGNRNDRNDRNDRGENHRRQRRQHDNRANREVMPSVTLEELGEMKVAELRARAAELALDAAGMKKAELVEAVYAATLKAEGFIEVSGVLDILADGYGFLRTSGYLPGEGDVYVGTSLIRRNGLRKGDFVVGQTRPARENEKFAAIQKIISVNGLTLEELKSRPRFGDLTPVYPDECLTMEHGKNTITARVIDLTSPIGKGQRGLIVSPPKAGKTTVLKDIAAAISANNPEVHLICLLVDERPEEVTDMQRSIKGEVVSSTFDMPTENHITVAELVIERAKRLVEMGKDVVVLLDSLTRLARAYNLAQPASGRILSGGVDSTALYPPKKFLGAARNIEGGGSLTILASALVETGSKMDEVIFEEFKGTGNMELKLDRNLADRRIFPAIDPVASGTRKEELLLDPQEAPLIWAVRRILSNMNNTERAMDMLIKSLKQTETNQEFLIRTAKKAQGKQHGKPDEGFGF